ncbi:hypothetical protein [Jannaschia rubra]|uniref:hypothetical protein n=1 Tax=Jannaschia rubra TaxID=282197 RepID=UPI003CD0DE42
MKYAVVQAHREEFGVRTRKDARQTSLIRDAWPDSGKVYGYRKLHDDLRDPRRDVFAEPRGTACEPRGDRSPDRLPAKARAASRRSLLKTGWTASSRSLSWFAGEPLPGVGCNPG